MPVILAIWLLGYEFFWRFENGFDRTTHIAIKNHSGAARQLIIRQTSTSTVDTIRRMFTDPRSATVHCAIWIEGTTDTIHTEAVGRYYTEFRPIPIATDSSIQVILIPNSEHDLPTGWGEMVYLDPKDSLRTMQIINTNITDIDKDGTFEVLDQVVHSWTKLDPATGKWVPVAVK